MGGAQAPPIFCAGPRKPCEAGAVSSSAFRKASRDKRRSEPRKTRRRFSGDGSRGKRRWKYWRRAASCRKRMISAARCAISVTGPCWVERTSWKGSSKPAANDSARSARTVRGRCGAWPGSPWTNGFTTCDSCGKRCLGNHDMSPCAESWPGVSPGGSISSTGSGMRSSWTSRKSWVCGCGPTTAID